MDITAWLIIENIFVYLSVYHRKGSSFSTDVDKTSHFQCEGSFTFGAGDPSRPLALCAICSQPVRVQLWQQLGSEQDEQGYLGPRLWAPAAISSSQWL